MDRLRIALLAIMTAVVAAAALTTLINSSRVASSPEPDTTFNFSPQPRPLVAFIGDSYTQGTAADSEDKRFVNILSYYEGWDFKNFGIGGTGYVQSGGISGCGLKYCPNYLGVIRSVARLRPDIVVISGGRNDLAVAPAELQRGVEAFYRELRSALPEATVITTSPIWDDDPAPRYLDRLQEWVAASTRSVGGHYLRLGEPYYGKKGWISQDGVHPNDSGHRILAERIEAALAGADLQGIGEATSSAG